MSMCRQIDNCANSVSEALVGTKGTAQADKYEITGAAAWKGEKDPISPYVQEHIDLIRIIRAGQKINELQTVAESTLTAIMGRMSAYSGKAVTWDEALNSTEALVPASLQLGPDPDAAGADARPGHPLRKDAAMWNLHDFKLPIASTARVATRSLARGPGRCSSSL